MKAPHIRCPSCRRNIELGPLTVGEDHFNQREEASCEGHCIGCNISALVEILMPFEESSRSEPAVRLEFTYKEFDALSSEDNLEGELRKFLARRWNKKHKPGDKKPHKK